MIDSAIFDNRTPTCGGGIDNDATLVVIDTTVADNFAGNCGGGILSDGAVVLERSALLGNFAERGSALMVAGPRVGRAGTADVTDTVVEGDCDIGQPLSSSGGNVESPGDTCGFDHPSDRVNVRQVDL